jgi:8-amino-7-oxononanoate synthase
VDLFERCRAFYADPHYAQGLGWPANPRTLEAVGLYPYFIPIERPEGTEAVIQGRRVLMLGSNNYLGLTTHPEVQEAAQTAIRRYGTGCTGSRFLNGTLELHERLEERLARFVGKQRALVFPTGFQTNTGTLAALLGKGDMVVADKEVHASLIDGIRIAHERGTESAFFRHGQVAHLERILRNAPAEQAKLVVVDGVFSMGGDVAPLPEIAAACRRHGARLFVDDAHGLGVLGGGRGTAAQLACTEAVDVIMGTFSKSLASAGGFIAGSREVIHFVQHFARPFMFSASLPPANAATVLACLDVIEREPERVARVNRLADRLREGLRAQGWDVGHSSAAIVPVVIGDQFRTVQAWKALFGAGVYTNAALPPAVPAVRSLLRASCIATHTDAHVERARAAFAALREKVLLRSTQREEVPCST